MTKRFKIILTISILLNLLFIGLAGGVTVKRSFYGPGEFGKPGWMKDLEPETRHLMARSFQQGKKEMKPHVTRLRQVKKDLARILKADEFDAEAYRAKSKEMGEIFAEMGQYRVEAMITVNEQLSQDERKKLAKRFERGGRKGGWHNKPKPE